MDPLTTARREALIIERRADRVPFREIAREVGVSHQRCYQIYQAALERIPASRLDEHRQEECEMADTAVRELLDIARNGDVFPGTRVKAWDSICKWSERKAKLLGLDAPQKREIEITDTSSWEFEMRRAIEETERELRTGRATQASREYT